MKTNHQMREIKARMTALRRRAGADDAVREKMASVEVEPIFWSRCRHCGTRRSGAKADLLTACPTCGAEYKGKVYAAG